MAATRRTIRIIQPPTSSTRRSVPIRPPTTPRAASFMGHSPVTPTPTGSSTPARKGIPITHRTFLKGRGWLVGRLRRVLENVYHGSVMRQLLHGYSTAGLLAYEQEYQGNLSTDATATLKRNGNGNPVNKAQGTAGYNTTFDLWSTAGTTSGSTSDLAKEWLKNW